MALPEPIVESLRQHGFRALKEGVWRRGDERWLPVASAAPQSWNRMLSPLLSEAILEAQAQAGGAAAKPLAVLYAPQLSDAMHERLVAFVQRVAPGQAWLAGDSHGRVFIHIPGEQPIRESPRRV